MALRNLLVQFDVEVLGEKQLRNIHAQLQRTTKQAEAFGRALKSFAIGFLADKVAGAIRDFVSEQIQLADALLHNSERLGLSTDELQKYEYVASLVGVSTKETAFAIRFFNRAVGEAALGTKVANKTFATLGINIKGADGQIRPTADLLAEFADKLAKIPSEATRTAYAMRLLGRNGSQFLPAIQRGGKELRDLFKDVDELGGGFNDKFIAQAHKTDVQLKRLQFGFRTVKTGIAIEVLPVVEWLTQKALELVKAFIDFEKRTYFVRTMLMALGGILAMVGAAFVALNPMLIPVAVALGLLLTPLVLIYLAFNDIYTLMKGGRSVLGEFLDRVGGKGTSTRFVSALKDAFNQLWAAIEPILPQLEALAAKIGIAFIDTLPHVISWGGQFATWVLRAVNAAVLSFQTLGYTVIGVFKAMDDAVHGKWADALKDLKEIKEKSDEAAKGAHERDEALSKVGAVFAGIEHPETLPPSPTPKPPNPAAPYAGLPPPPPPPVHVTVHQNIHGPNPQATADQANKGVSHAVKSAVTQNRDAFHAVNAGMPGPGY